MTEHEDKIYDDPESLHHAESGFVEERKVRKPWGWEKLLVSTPEYAMKFLFIRSGERLSVQYHERKRETLHCLEGEGNAHLGERGGDMEDHEFKPGTTLHVEPGTVHAFEAKTDMLLVEVSTPHIDDVVRLDDRYGRVQD